MGGFKGALDATGMPCGVLKQDANGIRQALDLVAHVAKL
jgi:hypothetical protein